MPSEELKLVQSAYKAFAEGDMPSVLGAMSSDLRWIPAEHSPYDRATPYIGPQEVLENVFLRIASEWEGFQVLPDRFLTAGDTIIMEGRYRGTNKLTSREMNAQVVHIWVVRNGKLTEFRQYTDTAHLRDVADTAKSGGAAPSP